MSFNTNYRNEEGELEYFSEPVVCCSCFRFFDSSINRIGDCDCDKEDFFWLEKPNQVLFTNKVTINWFDVEPQKYIMYKEKISSLDILMYFENVISPNYMRGNGGFFEGCCQTGEDTVEIYIGT